MFLRRDFEIKNNLYINHQIKNLKNRILITPY